jgi:hypothetical protein
MPSTIFTNHSHLISDPDLFQLQTRPSTRRRISDQCRKMSGSSSLNNDNVQYGKQEFAHCYESTEQEQPIMSGSAHNHSALDHKLLNGNENGYLLESSVLFPKTLTSVVEASRKASIPPSSTTTTDTETSRTSSGLLVKRETPRNSGIDDIVHCLEDVHKRMDHFGTYIKAQKEHDKPLFQWEKYGAYTALKTAVSKLEQATTKFKPARVLPEYLAESVARATHSSTSVSGAAVYVLEVINKKTSDYMDETETSKLSEDAKAQANVVITEEVGRLMEHSTRATEQVWRATDMLRECKEKSNVVKDWAWSATATIMTSFIAATVAIFAAHLYGPKGLDVVAGSGHNTSMYHQVLDLVQRTHALTNFTGDIYNTKIQDMDQRYNDLAALSESHGIRIDNIVDGLGPPNSEGTYYHSTSQTDGATCEQRIQKIFQQLSLQSKRQQEDLATMRKDMHRMDIRLTEGVKKSQKK